MRLGKSACWAGTARNELEALPWMQVAPRVTSSAANGGEVALAALCLRDGDLYYYKVCVRVHACPPGVCGCGYNRCNRRCSQRRKGAAQRGPCPAKIDGMRRTAAELDGGSQGADDGGAG